MVRHRQAIESYSSGADLSRVPPFRKSNPNCCFASFSRVFSLDLPAMDVVKNSTAYKESEAGSRGNATLCLLASISDCKKVLSLFLPESNSLVDDLNQKLTRLLLHPRH